MIQTSSYWQQLLASVLAEKIGSGGFTGPLNGLTLFLFSNQLLLSPQTAFGDLTESTWSGYARYANLGWGAPILQPDGTYTILSALVTFSASAVSTFVPGLVWGWGLIDTASTPHLIMAEQFSQPVAITNPGDGFGLVIEFNVLPLNQNSFGQVLA